MPRRLRSVTALSNDAIANSIVATLPRLPWNLTTACRTRRDNLKRDFVSDFFVACHVAIVYSLPYYVRISAVSAQEPMSVVTVVVGEVGDEPIAKRVIATSRQFYAKIAKSEERQRNEPKQADNAKTSQKLMKPKKTQSTKRPDSDLSGIKPVS